MRVKSIVTRGSKTERLEKSVVSPEVMIISFKMMLSFFFY